MNIPEIILCSLMALCFIITIIMFQLEIKNKK